jgi:hypothetical protein
MFCGFIGQIPTLNCISMSAGQNPTQDLKGQGVSNFPHAIVTFILPWPF